MQKELLECLHKTLQINHKKRPDEGKFFIETYWVITLCWFQFKLEKHLDLFFVSFKEH